MRKSLRLLAAATLALAAALAPSNATAADNPATTSTRATWSKACPVSLDLEIHELYVKEIMKTTDPDAHYYVSYLEKNLYKEYGYDDDDKLAEEDEKWMKEMAASYEMDMSEFIDQMTYQGDNTDFQAGLLPDHDYIIWLHGIDDEGACDTEIKRVEFHTKPVQPIDNKIALTAERTADGVKVTITPDDPDRYYTFGSIAKGNMKDEFTGKDLSIRDYMQYGFSNSLWDYLDANEFDAIFDEMAMKGNFSLTYGNLEEGVDYYIVAAYLDNEAGINSEISVISIDGEGNITGVKGVAADGYKASAKRVYSVNGTFMGSSTEGLPKGVYIVKDGDKSKKIMK